MYKDFNGTMSSDDPDAIAMLKKGLGNIKEQLLYIEVDAYSHLNGNGGCATDSGMKQWFHDFLKECGLEEELDKIQEVTKKCAGDIADVMNDAIEKMGEHNRTNLAARITVMNMRNPMKRKKTLSNLDDKIEGLLDSIMGGEDMQDMLGDLLKDAVLKNSGFSEEEQEILLKTSQQTMLYVRKLTCSNEQKQEFVDEVGKKVATLMAEKEEVDIMEIFTEIQDEIGLECGDEEL